MIGLFPDEYNGIKLTQQALNDLILVPLNLSETIIKTKGKEEDSALTDEQAFKKGIESRFLSCKTGKIRNIKRVCQFNLCIAVLAVEDSMELIIKGDFDTVGFVVI